MPSGRPTSTQPPAWTRPKSRPSSREAVPDRVEREDVLGDGGDGGGVDDPGAGVDERRALGGAAAGEPAVGGAEEVAGAAVADGGVARDEGEERAHRRPPGGDEGGERVRAAPDHVGVEGEDRARPEQRQRALEAAAGLEPLGLVGDRGVGGDAGEVVGDLGGVGVGVDDDARDARVADERERMVEERAAGDGDQRLRPVAGEIAHAGAEAGGEDHHGVGGGHGRAIAPAGSAAAIRASTAGPGAGTWRATKAARGARPGWARSRTR